MISWVPGLVGVRSRVLVLVLVRLHLRLRRRGLLRLLGRLLRLDLGLGLGRVVALVRLWDLCRLVGNRGSRLRVDRISVRPSDLFFPRSSFFSPPRCGRRQELTVDLTVSVRVCPGAVDHNNRTTTWVDPRRQQLVRVMGPGSQTMNQQQSVSQLGPLPSGWEMRLTSTARVYFGEFFFRRRRFRRFRVRRWI